MFKESQPKRRIKKALSAIQSAFFPEALVCADNAKQAKDHSFVIVGVGLDKNLDDVKAAINKTYLPNKDEHSTHPKPSHTSISPASESLHEMPNHENAPN